MKHNKNLKWDGIKLDKGTEVSLEYESRKINKKKAHTVEYKDVILSKCKDHGGPFVNIREVIDFINQTTDQKVLERRMGSKKYFIPMMYVNEDTFTKWTI